jgi:uncharacterized membrane protein YgdD (TMEM256/DUF423 family)
MNKNIVLTASVFGVLAVMLGAFGAHSLRDLISEQAVANWAKGVEYQFYHVFALLFLALCRDQNKLTKFAHWFFTAGIILFSGSLYLLSTREIHHWTIAAYVGPITPIGGLCLILGWLMLFFSVSKSK